MLITNIIMIVLLYYQVTMPATQNSKYTITNKNGQIVRMNTQNGEMEVCDDSLKCKAPDQ